MTRMSEQLPRRPGITTGLVSGAAAAAANPVASSFTI